MDDTVTSISEGIVPQHQSLKPGLFLAESWRVHLELLEHLCYYSDHLLLVLGPPLAGKSSFLELFLQRETPGLGKQKIVLGLGETAHQLLGSLDQSCSIVLVDNADKASDEVLLALLKRSSAYHHKEGFHLVFFAAPGFEVRLIQPLFLPYIQGRVHTIEMEPFSLEEATIFLSRAQFEGRGLAIAKDAEHIRVLFERAGGFPGKMLQLVHSFKKGGWLRRSHFFTENLTSLWESPFFWAVFLSVFFVAVFGVLFFTQEPKMIQHQPLSMRLDKGVSFVEAVKEKKEFKEFKESTGEISEPQKTVIGYGSEPRLLPAPTAERGEKEIPTVGFQPKEALAVGGDSLVDAPSTVQPKIQLPAVAAKPLVTTPKVAYTVQILGARNEKNVQRFIERYRLKEARYIKSSMKGRPWYILSYGTFSTREQAEHALHSLPKEVRALKPWVRRSE